MTADNDTFKDLDTFTIAFDNLYVNFDSIPRRNAGISSRSCSCSSTLIMFIALFPPIRHSYPVAAMVRSNRHMIPIISGSGLPKITKELYHKKIPCVKPFFSQNRKHEET